jgi:hypothetical protein
MLPILVLIIPIHPPVFCALVATEAPISEVGRYWREMTTEFWLSVFLSYLKGCFTFRTFLRHGADGFAFPPKEVVLRTSIVSLTTHPHLVLRSIKSRSYTSSSPCLLQGGSGAAYIRYKRLKSIQLLFELANSYRISEHTKKVFIVSLLQILTPNLIRQGSNS